MTHEAKAKAKAKDYRNCPRGSSRPRTCPRGLQHCLKVVSESRVTWTTFMPILVFLGLSVLDLGPMYATDRQTDVSRASSLNASALWGRGITTDH